MEPKPKKLRECKKCLRTSRSIRIDLDCPFCHTPKEEVMETASTKITDGVTLIHYPKDEGELEVRRFRRSWETEGFEIKKKGEGDWDYRCGTLTFDELKNIMEVCNVEFVKVKTDLLSISFAPKPATGKAWKELRERMLQITEK